MSHAGDPLSDPIATLTENGRKARYGVSYLRNICSQAGVPLTENSPDEDVLAVDCLVNFIESPVRVQVKCTSKRKVVGWKSTSWPVEDHWRTKWSGSKIPVYFVMVVVPATTDTWLAHEPDHTRHNTVAFWSRIQPGLLGKSVKVPISQRLTADTIRLWHRDLATLFTPPGLVIP